MAARSARGASGTRPARSSPARICSPSASAASGPRSATRPAPITARSRSSSTCSARARSGIELTESFAMTPAAAVSGIYLAHPEARYFAVGADRQRPARGLRRAQGRAGVRRRALAAAESRSAPPEAPPPGRVSLTGLAPRAGRRFVSHEDDTEERRRARRRAQRQRPFRLSARPGQHRRPLPRSPPPPGGAASRLLRRILVGTLLVVVSIALGVGGGAYLWFHQSVNAVKAHSTAVKIAQKQLDIPLPGQPAVALVLGYDRRVRASRDRLALRHDHARARRPAHEDDLAALVPARPHRPDLVQAPRVRLRTGSTPPMRSAARRARSRPSRS